MLHLYQSNRLEDLAQMMAKLHAIEPVSSPLIPEQIVIQSQGMRRFINQYLAREQGIAANIQFSLPASFSFRLMREMMPDTPELNPFDTEVMRWRLLDLFQSDRFQNDEFQIVRQALNPYLGNGEYAAYQLAGQLADVFDQYLVYRPDWIETWHKGVLVAGLSDEQIWQAPLWRYLDNGRQSAPHRVQLWHSLMNHLDDPPRWLSERFFVFGIATLAPMYLELFIRLAKTREVHIFALNPSEYYWGQIIEPIKILRQSETLDLTLQGHPLLASLGKQGRDFFDALSEANVAVDINSFDDSYFSHSLLHNVQHNIQTQTLPVDSQWRKLNHLTSENSLTFLQYHDRSIQIHSAHSPLRELQILKDQIIKLLSKNPTWQPHDIAILTPNIEPYAPYLQAVFGQQTGSGQALPYSLSDVKLSRHQPLLYALEQVLELLDSRFEVDKLLALLDNDVILQQFDLVREDLSLIHDTVMKLNIHWGVDAAQRAEFGGCQDLFTWQQGLERLVLGWMLPEKQTHHSLWQGIYPWFTRPDYLQVLNKFVFLVRELTKIQHEWQQPVGIEKWVLRVRQFLTTMFLPSHQDKDAIEQLEQSLTRWIEESELADFQHNLSQQTVIYHIKRFLNQSNEAGFLRGGITFCSMVPMRSLPFKMIGLIGLNDGDFPRNTKAASFDLIAKHPKKGDRARRDDDRYLFLEALLSARELLYLSFIGKDIRTDETLAPSTLLHELIDCVGEMAGLSSEILFNQWIVYHPLQPFSRKYFQARKIDNSLKSNNNQLISTRTDYAAALNQPAVVLGDFFRQPEKMNNQPIQLIEQQQFIQFWRNPVRRYLSDVLNWQAPYTQKLWDANEPFKAEQTKLIADAYIQARRQKQDFTDLANQLAAQSLLPMGYLGELVQRDFAMQTAMLDGFWLNSPELPERSGVLQTDSGSLSYRLSHQYEQGQIIYINQFLREFNTQDKLQASDKIELILQHIIFCAATSEQDEWITSKQTYLIQLPDIITLPALPQSKALAILNNWIKYYKQGLVMPLPFFPRVQLKAAYKLFDTKTGQLDRKGMIQEAARVYHAGYQGFAQEDYPEVKLVYGRNTHAEPPYLSDLFMDLTMDLFGDLQDCLKVLND